MNEAELREGIVSAAYLEGDFLLRSGKRSRYYLDKFRFETQPDLLAALGERIAAAVRQYEPEAVRLAAPVLGAVPLAAAASLASGLPFVIVRDEAKAYGTANRLEGAFEEGALVESISAVRDAGLVVRSALCVIDREEGGADALARHAVRLRPLFRAGDLLQGEKTPAKPHG
jgi:orotate phosphoribosyltransferase